MAKLHQFWLGGEHFAKIFRKETLSRLIYFSLINLHVSATGIQFCYKSNNRRSWQCCTIAIAMIIVLAILTYFLMLPYAPLTQLRFLFIMVVQNCVLIFVPISFITLLRGLHQRYAALNSYLRYYKLFKFEYSRSN